MIELLVVIAIGAIIAALAAPSMHNWLINQRVASAAAELVNSLNYARSEALQSQQSNQITVYFSISESGGNCYTIGSGGGSGSTCDCTLGAGSACYSATPDEVVTEYRTVQLDSRLGVVVNRMGGRQPSYNKTTGLLTSISPSSIKIEVRGSNGNILEVSLAPRTGRPRICSVGGTIPGYQSC
ncbi:MAG: hypothetical protein HY021_00295 [Burkholderiales bacterium]|nr:hypothetical protein [Burkholderiales bacterium]